MIEMLQHEKLETAKTIRHVFQLSYAIEAELLKAKEFPPLKRPLEAYSTSQNAFYGFLIEEELAAVIEIDHKTEAIHIQSLVVHPKFFRRGIAAKLIAFVFKTYNSKVYTVETGLANAPACKLYEKLGFKEVKQYNAEHGIRKICFVINS